MSARARFNNVGATAAQRGATKDFRSVARSARGFPGKVSGYKGPSAQ